MLALKLADGERGAAQWLTGPCVPPRWLYGATAQEPRSRRAEVLHLPALFSSALCSSWELWECPVCFEARYQVCPGCVYGAGMACLCLTPPLGQLVPFSQNDSWEGEPGAGSAG